VNCSGRAPNPGATITSSDLDNDGIPNDWEIINGFNPTDPADAAADADGDGLSNLQEYLAGTNPRDPRSVLRADVRVNSSGGLVLTFTAVANRSYTIEFRDSLVPAAWQKLTDISPAASDRVLQLPITTATSSRFFRIVLNSPP